ncbi:MULTISPECIES: hypothetical protein [unclassified Streptomyces]|uniref:hypothetical protein n=1 Tax=unclassified Streptomyces TaxID=2593676 RepID=UPI0037FB6C55
MCSLLYAVGTLLAGPQALSAPGGIAILLSRLFIAVRHCRPPWAVVFGNAERRRTAAHAAAAPTLRVAAVSAAHPG